MAAHPEGGKAARGTLVPEVEILVRSERDGTVNNVNNFLERLRTRNIPNANIPVAFEAARTSWIGNIALKRGMKVVRDASKGRIAWRSLARLRHGVADPARAPAR
jgi:hypothetical protein